MRKLFLASFFALLSICTYAYDFEVDGIYYNITGDNTVEVTSNDGQYAGDIIIPNKVSYDSKEYSVTSIRENAFYNCSSLTAIDIPASVTSIGNIAFFKCSGLTAINIPESVKSIGYGAFACCRGLTSIVVASGNSVYDSRNNCNAIIKTSDNSLVSGCKNTVIPSNVTSIESGAFQGCSSLTAIDIPGSVKSIENSAFESCSSLIAIDIPGSVKSIGEHAFYVCSNLTSINIPEGVESIERSTFDGCSSLTTIDIPASVKSIGVYAFSNCSSLTAINIPESVTSIGYAAFLGCSSLTAINIPASVTVIESWAFYNCDSLADIYCYASTPAGTVSDTFSQNTYSGCTLHVPYGTMNAYRAAANWKKFVNIVEFDPTGVGAVSADGKSAAEQRIYNLGGVRMAAPQRGLNIINGKKVVY